jgi:hypothetical protein
MPNIQFGCTFYLMRHEAVNTSKNETVRTRAKVSPRIRKKITKHEIPIISGRVTNMQKGQHGPEMTMGVPSDAETRANM